MSDAGRNDRRRYQRPGEQDRARLGDLVYTWDSGYATGQVEALRWAYEAAQRYGATPEHLEAIASQGRRYASR